MIRVTDQLAVAEQELAIRFVRASGPGGQNVNKVATAVELRFDLARSPSLPDDVRARALARASRWLTQDGILVIKAQEHRTQEANRTAAIARLVNLLRAAAIPPKPRRPTKPTKASIVRHRVAKERRSRIKTGRTRPPSED